MAHHKTCPLLICCTKEIFLIIYIRVKYNFFATSITKLNSNNT